MAQGNVLLKTVSVNSVFPSGLDAAAGMEDSELQNLGGEQTVGLDSAGPKHPDFANRPAGK